MSQTAVSPLQIGLFRALWLAALVSNVGGWMQLVAAQWLMTELSSSVALVALLSSAAALPTFLLALPAGALADVVDRRRLILITQGWQLAVAAGLAALSLADRTSPGLLIGATVALAAGAVLGLPAFTAITPQLVAREQLAAAISLTSVTTTLAQAIGPALGGLLVASLGAGAVFALNATSFLGVVIVVARWRRPTEPAALPAEHVLGAVRSGARYVRAAPELRAVLVRCVGYLLGYAGLPALLALYTRRQLHEEAAAYGLLLAALGLGGVAGALALPRLRARLSPDLILAGASLGYAAAIVLAARTDALPVALAILLVAGAAGVLGMASLNIAAQSLLPEWVRGRGLAVLQLTAQGTFAVGAAAWGAIASRTSIPTAMEIAAGCLAASVLLGARYGLTGAERLDVAPAERLEPFDAVVLLPGRDPVEITVSYRVPADRSGALLELLRPLRALRRREGATSWGMTADLSDPAVHTERFVVGSWEEHLRSAERLTGQDRLLLDRLASLHESPDAPRTHAARCLSTRHHRSQEPHPMPASPARDLTALS